MNRIKMYIFTIVVLFLGVLNVNALSVSKNDITIERGQSNSIELYANSETEIKSVDFTLVFSTYDIPAYFTPATGNNDTNPNGIAHHVVLGQASSGKVLLGTIDINVKLSAVDTTGVISLSNTSAMGSNGNKINLNIQNINVKVGTPEVTTDNQEDKKEEKDKNLLDKIESNIVTIELKKDVFDYTVTIPESVKELDLKATAKDSNAKVDISTQKIKDLKDNKIIITVKSNDIEQKYTINVKTKKEDTIKIDKSEFEGSTSYKGKWTLIIVILVVVLVFSLIFNKKK